MALKAAKASIPMDKALNASNSVVIGYVASKPEMVSISDFGKAYITSTEFRSNIETFLQ